jgi:endoglycosylceramidase
VAPTAPPVWAGARASGRLGARRRRGDLAGGGADGTGGRWGRAGVSSHRGDGCGPGVGLGGGGGWGGGGVSAGVGSLMGEE